MEGRFNGGFFAFRVWWAYIWRGLYMEGLISGILRYINKTHTQSGVEKSHLKDATDFINLIEKSKVKKPNVSCLD